MAILVALVLSNAADQHHTNQHYGGGTQAESDGPPLPVPHSCAQVQMFLLCNTAPRVRSCPRRQMTKPPRPWPLAQAYLFL